MLLRSLVIRPPQKLVAQLQAVDPKLWNNRLELMKEVVDRVMDAEMQRAGFIRRDGSRQPLDLPYSYVIHASEDKKGVESPHAHVIVPAVLHSLMAILPFLGFAHGCFLYQKESPHFSQNRKNARPLARIYGIRYGVGNCYSMGLLSPSPFAAQALLRYTL